MELLRTVHGSHLYGLNHAGSDLDYFMVYEGKFKTEQTIVDGLDSVVMSLDSFLLRASSGSPQSLEAMFSRKAEVDALELREGFRVDSALARQVYSRTIRAFAHGDLKRQRHAIRLTLNLNDLVESGRFDPALSDEQRAFVLDLSDELEYDDLMISLSEFSLIDLSEDPS